MPTSVPYSVGDLVWFPWSNRNGSSGQIGQIIACRPFGVVLISCAAGYQYRRTIARLRPANEEERYAFLTARLAR